MIKYLKNKNFLRLTKINKNISIIPKMKAKMTIRLKVARIVKSQVVRKTKAISGQRDWKKNKIIT